MSRAFYNQGPQAEFFFSRANLLGDMFIIDQLEGVLFF